VSKAPYNPFDLTKFWPHKDYPLIEVGEFELNRNPENYFADIKQAVLSPTYGQGIADALGISIDEAKQLIKKVLLI
tara:strand:- start:168 stop:395 length:228 start_codon:yes stop_codon:yes gene_type:complete